MKREDLDFLRVADVERFHAEGLARHGGSAGVLDARKLEAAVEAPQNGYHDTLATVATAYAVGIANAHAFVDGNKRAAFQAAWHFLEMNLTRPIPKTAPIVLAQTLERVVAREVLPAELVAAIVDAIGGDVPIDE